jgi:hypothetical protein
LLEIIQRGVVYGRHENKLLQKGVIMNSVSHNDITQAFRLLKEGTNQSTVLRHVRFMKTNVNSEAEHGLEKSGMERAHYSYLLGFLTAVSILCPPSQNWWLDSMRNEPRSIDNH